MRKLYSEFFHVPNHGKIREKVMLAHVAMTIAIMIMCLAAMGITAYAYFSYNVTSGSNIIKAANFEADVSITTDSSRDITVTKDGKIQTATLTAGEYTVKLTKGDSTADTGFCIITIGGDKYHTGQIGEDALNKLTDARVTFTLIVSAETKIDILSHWGTSSFYGYVNLDSDPLYIKDESTVIIEAGTANSDSESYEEKETTSTEITIPTTKDPTEVIHEVQSGGSLWEIAQKYGTSVEVLKAYNKLMSNTINVGQKLKIPPADWVIPADTTEQTTTIPETTVPDATTTTEITTPETTGTNESTSTTEPETATTESAVSETTTAETANTESTDPSISATEPTTETTEPAVSETTTAETANAESTEQTRLATETETTGVPTTEASE